MGAVSAVPGLAGSMVALGLFQLTATLSGAKAGTRAVAVAALIGALAQVVAAFVLVARLGITGAALASLLGYVVAAAAMTWTTRLVSLRAGGSLLIAAALIVAAGLGLASWLMWSPLGIRLGVVLVTAIVGGPAFLRVRSHGGRVTP
jgi:O-antigen/teichoic acid export membrane protein